MPSTNSSKPRRNQTARQTVSDADAAAYLNEAFGRGRWTFDPASDCWLAPDLDDDCIRIFFRDGRTAFVPAGAIQ